MPSTADFEAAFETALRFWSSDKLTGSQTGSSETGTGLKFWSSDKLTGSQTPRALSGKGSQFWSSDKLTGSQTWRSPWTVTPGFWSSDKLTGSQTRVVLALAEYLFWSSDKLTGSQTIEREYGKLADVGWFVKGTTAKAIVYHELGHCIEKLLKVDSVSVAHGIIGERNEELLRASVAGSLSRYAARKTAKGRKTVFGEEIMPEVISAWLSGVDNEFAKKFASLIGLV